MGGSDHAAEEEAVSTAPAVVSITSGFGSVYFARVADINAARSRGECDVPLCRTDGSSIPATSSQRDRLRLSTINASIIAPFPPPPAPMRPPARAPAPGMRTDDKALFVEAKQEIDLAAFLAQHGFVIVAKGDGVEHLIMEEPKGAKVRVYLAQNGKDWLYEDLHAGRVGDILLACKNLLGMSYGRAIGVIRAAVRNPPSPLQNRRGQTVADDQPSPPRTLALLEVQGRRYLTEVCCLHPSTLDAFHHAIHGNLQGSVVFAHNRSGDGEELSLDGQSFHGSRRDGPGRGRSLYVAQPHADQEPPVQIIVAESSIDALSVWEMLDATAQPMTAVASTSDEFCELGKTKLERVLKRMVEHHRMQGAPVLVDATNAGETRDEQRTIWLQKLTERVGAIYHRVEPSHQVRDWNQELQAVKTAVKKVQEDAQAAEGGRSYPVAAVKSEEVHEGYGRRLGGRKR